MRALSTLTLGVALAAAPSAEAAPGDARETRTIDGTDNNRANPTWGSADVPLLRTAPAAYADGTDAAAGSRRPSARRVSNAVAAQGELVPDPFGASDMVWQWGQFLDHDLTLVPILAPPEHLDVAVPRGDEWFDPFGTGLATIAFERSYYEHDAADVRQQTNEITSYIDASNVYGSDAVRAEALRTLDGSGRLKTSAGDLLPFNLGGLPNAPSNDPGFYIAGDFRANEQVGLTAMHVLFVRDHNHWAERIASQQLGGGPQGRGGGHPAQHRRRRSDGGGGGGAGDGAPLTGDEIYEAARAIVAAEMQVITYNEFLPVVLGPNALPPYTGYRPDVDATIANEFATAAYRFGHTMLSPVLKRVGPGGGAIPEGDLALQDAFFHPSALTEGGGIEPLLRGLATQRAQRVDTQLVDDVRNFLFGPPGSGGFDLASLNLQRGRDHGLADYNTVRESHGLPRRASFAEITSDAELARTLRRLYGSIDDVDLWVAGLAEDRVPGALVGETFHAILVRQFAALRDGDRFWYRRDLPPNLVDLVERQTLARILRRNTAIGSELQDDVFRASEP